jgi:hypothetical protein
MTAILPNNWLEVLQGVLRGPSAALFIAVIVAGLLLPVLQLAAFRWWLLRRARKGRTSGGEFSVAMCVVAAQTLLWLNAAPLAALFRTPEWIHVLAWPVVLSATVVGFSWVLWVGNTLRPRPLAAPAPPAVEAELLREDLWSTLCSVCILAAGLALLAPAPVANRFASVVTGVFFVHLTWLYTLLRDPARRARDPELDCRYELKSWRMAKVPNCEAPPIELETEVRAEAENVGVSLDRVQAWTTDYPTAVTAIRVHDRVAYVTPAALKALSPRGVALLIAAATVYADSPDGEARAYRRLRELTGPTRGWAVCVTAILVLWPPALMSPWLVVPSLCLIGLAGKVMRTLFARSRWTVTDAHVCRTHSDPEEYLDALRALSSALGKRDLRGERFAALMSCSPSRGTDSALVGES